MGGGRNRKNAIQDGQDNINPLYNAEVARQAEHERQREAHLKQLRAQHLKNIGGDKPKMSDQELANMEQQDKAFATNLKDEDQSEANLQQDVLEEMDQDQQEKKKNGKKLDKNKKSIDF
jgi:hypothetical protein